MSAHVFTYGSLMFDPVWQRVVRGRYRSTPATLDGHVRLIVEGETYPGMIVRTGSQVAGVLYFDVDTADLAALDYFEGQDYERICVSVNTDFDGIVQAETYLYLPVQRLLDQAWEPGAFQMQRFLQTYCREKLGD
jgi:gamma-glutamylcyclotransferase (GGCT)/AIG2-like uncharacterized protein YtfP